MADGDVITVAFIQAEVSKHTGLKKIAIELTNQFAPAAAVIDDDSFEVAFDTADNEFQKISGNKPREGFAHDEKGMLYLTIAELFSLALAPQEYVDKYSKPGKTHAKNAGKRRTVEPATADDQSKQKFSKEVQIRSSLPRQGDPSSF